MKVGIAMALTKFQVNWIAEKASKLNTHQMLLSPLGSVTVDRDASASPVWQVWLPAAAVAEYTGLLVEAQAASMKFVVEAEVAGIRPKAVFTKQDGSRQQDLVIKFAGKVSKSVEADTSVEW
jgi:hypothetical protein